MRLRRRRSTRPRAINVMRLVSWNVAGRVKRLDAQVEFLAQIRPDLVALQEVTNRTCSRLREGLSRLGLVHQADSIELHADELRTAGPRRYALLLASRYPLRPVPELHFDVPWQERALVRNVMTASRSFDWLTTYIPPGSSNGWIKVEVLEGIFSALARAWPRPRILCGDFNTPREETIDGKTITFGDRRGDRWVRAEWNILRGLADHGLPDVYRDIHGYGRLAYSWVVSRSDQSRLRRFDHVFASSSLKAVTCKYLHQARVNGFSDHAPIVVEFADT